MANIWKTVKNTVFVRQRPGHLNSSCHCPPPTLYVAASKPMAALPLAQDVLGAVAFMGSSIPGRRTTVLEYLPSGNLPWLLRIDHLQMIFLAGNLRSQGVFQLAMFDYQRVNVFIHMCPAASPSFVGKYTIHGTSGIDHVWKSPVIWQHGDMVIVYYILLDRCMQQYTRKPVNSIDVYIYIYIIEIDILHIYPPCKVRCGKPSNCRSLSLWFVQSFFSLMCIPIRFCKHPIKCCQVKSSPQKK